jgi:predicted PurR-regulated permease PerM
LFIVLGFVLAFIFSPIYNLLLKVIKSPTVSASILSIILIAIVILPIWFFTPTLIDQIFNLYQVAQKTDFVAIFKNIFPSFFASEQFSSEIGATLQSFITNIFNSILNKLGEIILNFPTIMLNSVVVLFTFFFALKEKDKLFAFIKSLSPFSKEVEIKLAQSSRDITASVLYGHVIIGVLQGVIISIGLFAFKAPNTVLLSILATIAGVLPIVGPMLVWAPIAIYFFIAQNTFAAVGILILGLIASNLEHFLRPFLISRRTQLHSVVVLIGMIGGLFLFGIMGLILGPLILAYLLIILEVYRNRKPGTSFSLLKED